MNPVNIINRNRLTIIEGYDINIYNMLKAGYIVDQNSYKNIILEAICKDNILLSIEKVALSRTTSFSIFPLIYYFNM